MSACKTGCGEVCLPGEHLFCENCRSLWVLAPERYRFCAVTTKARETVALVDFCARVRAERLNGGGNGRA